MSAGALIHPDLRAAVATLGPLDPFTDIAATRATAQQATPPVLDEDGIAVEDRIIRGPTGLPLTLRVYRPVAPDAPHSPSPAVMWCHGGGFALGGLDTEDGHCRRMVGDYECVPPPD